MHNQLLRTVSTEAEVAHYLPDQAEEEEVLALTTMAPEEAEVEEADANPTMPPEGNLPGEVDAQV